MMLKNCLVLILSAIFTTTLIAGKKIGEAEKNDEEFSIATPISGEDLNNKTMRSGFSFAITIFGGDVVEKRISGFTPRINSLLGFKIGLYTGKQAFDILNSENEMEIEYSSKYGVSFLAEGFIADNLIIATSLSFGKTGLGLEGYNVGSFNSFEVKTELGFSTNNSPSILSFGTAYRVHFFSGKDIDTFKYFKSAELVPTLNFGIIF